MARGGNGEMNRWNFLKMSKFENEGGVRLCGKQPEFYHVGYM